MNEPLSWKCDECGEDIVDGDGYITIDESEVAEAQEKMQAWRTAHPEDPSGFTAYNLGELMEQPEDVHWRVLHDRCDPIPEAGGYTISVSRIRTYQAALAWSLHLLGSKEWVVKLTDWAEFLRRRTDVEIPG